MNKKMKLMFSLDYNGQCEDIEDFSYSGQDFTDDISFGDVNKFVKVLKGIEGFNVSPHRTIVTVIWYDNGTMKVQYDYFTEPDWDSFKIVNLDGLPSVNFPR